jgi:Rrf2 family transcriptional regulator, nitric oxide-sensitive transcriptional repressor
MNRINRKVEYALMALKFMSQKYAGQLTSAKEICQSTGIPFDATSKVMQLMAQKGILKSEQGAHGGYLIARDLTKVSFYDVAETILGPVEVVRCASASKEASCEFLNKCNVQSPLQNLNSRVVGFYQTVTVAELLWQTQTQRST